MGIRQGFENYSERFIDQFDRLVLGDVNSFPVLMETQFNRQAIDEMEVIVARLDSKASATLTHISMMIAAATFVISSDTSSLPEKVVIFFEVSAYLFAALCCLRCLVFHDRMFGSQSGRISFSDTRDNEYGHFLVERVFRSSQLLNLAVKVTFFVTFVFALSLAAHILL